MRREQGVRLISWLLGYVDAAAHTLHLPKPLQRGVCYVYDRTLGYLDGKEAVT